jgi:omega-amidase
MNLTLSLAQMAVLPGQPAVNLAKAEELIAEAARRGSTLICFPEMWTSGFAWSYLKSAMAEHRQTVDAVAALARRYRIWINGSLPTAAARGGVANSSLLFGPDGTVAGRYDKAHLFTLLHEEQHLVAGDSLTLLNPPWGATGLAICYDLRFPELFRSYALQGARLVLLPAAFPHPRLDHWQVLTRARAIENQLFFVAVNRVGSEDFAGDGTAHYCGSSRVIDPWGTELVAAGEGEETVLTVTIDLQQAEQVRTRMGVFADRRPELYRLDP